mgnify:CR=1 FL=1
MKLRPLLDRVVIRENTEETRTPGGLVLPGSAEKRIRSGEVLAVGPGSRALADGARVPPEVRPGDVVCWSSRADVFEIDVAGEKLIATHAGMLIGVLEP